MIIKSCLSPNVGDNLNKELARLLSGEEPRLVNNLFKNKNKEDIYLFVGSVLGWACESSIVIGAGFISNSDFITGIPKPKKVLGVRGKYTRTILLNKGIDCPSVFGDPAMLFKKFYNPSIEKKYDIGFVPHTIDIKLKDKFEEQFPFVHFIDIRKGIYEFINDISQCKNIITSSLHGMILSDTYNIANCWIKMSDNVLGNGFKMKDYFSSTNRQDKEPLVWTNFTTENDIRRKLTNWNEAEIDLKPLWDAIPFKKKGLKW